MGLATGLVHAIESGKLYRYIGSNNEMVIDDHIPPEYIQKGYAILNSQGFVIEKVAPVMSKEERTKLTGEARSKAKFEAEQQEIEGENKRLLLRYSDSEDAVLARDRQLGALETMIVIVQGSIKKLKKEEQKELESAAASERRGEEVAPIVLESLQRVRQQIRDAEQQVQNQRIEQQQLRQQFEVTIGRLKEITGK